ncbi:hypothetical protein CWS02_08735 [Enterobacter sp. EA-1]|nr:hypothetical protein CWS02_08735 [Enterobacter sp. EA-1]
MMIALILVAIEDQGFAFSAITLFLCNLLYFKLFLIFLIICALFFVAICAKKSSPHIYILKHLLLNMKHLQSFRIIF